ncbi:unnamed protein product [Miscanthus lutarioriparius]|uniref:Serine-threonine/tyrosine-protein kinase catalytic domain-containing protein n=1 Tax=Miscanthus lutarioriparius TaxID=422564 RepID=A0A811R0P6_9POAL|nr:unnamed protein product [Miscanthus lutarioriparius]
MTGAPVHAMGTCGTASRPLHPGPTPQEPRPALHIPALRRRIRGGRGLRSGDLAFSSRHWDMHVELNVIFFDTYVASVSLIDYCDGHSKIILMYEYVEKGTTGDKLTDKSDVYSFGVVLLEVICASSVSDLTLPRDMINLAESAIEWQKRGELDQIINPRITGTIRLQALRKCPTMGDVLWNLEFVLQLHEAGPDMSNIDRMNQISELHSNAKRASSLGIKYQHYRYVDE